ncbi:hypothetical protein Tco_0926808 [Tanacetum coccineum]|uniref:Uncharacterized protein n=1 Tax=Tanacetum coccineum TaxID=301880 RepID=A0ABQ5DH52_9ASTR
MDSRLIQYNLPQDKPLDLAAVVGKLLDLVAVVVVWARLGIFVPVVISVIRQRFNPDFEMVSIQYLGLAPAIEEPFVFDHIGAPVQITEVHVERNMCAAHVKSDSMSWPGVRKCLMSNMFYLHAPVDRGEPLSPVAKTISIDQNVRRCLASFEEQATKFFRRFRNTCSNDF